MSGHAEDKSPRSILGSVMRVHRDPEAPAHGPEPANESSHLPPPSIWPLVLAGGISLLTAGVAVGPVVGVVGFILLAIGLGGWIQEMRHGH